MTERIEELVEIISELQMDSIRRKDFESFLDIAIAGRLLFRALPGADAQCRSVLDSMENAIGLLIGKDKPVKISESELACSFCGKKRPEVQLGAGPDAFICNECVDLFAEIFRTEKEHRESPDKQV